METVVTVIIITTERKTTTSMVAITQRRNLKGKRGQIKPRKVNHCLSNPPREGILDCGLKIKI
jgi:hypothetical protein